MTLSTVMGVSLAAGHEGGTCSASTSSKTAKVARRCVTIAGSRLSTSRCVVPVAKAAARPTIGTLNGRRAALLNGSQSLQATFPSEIAQPYSLICVSHLTGSTSLSRVVHDGIVATKRATLFHQASTGKAVIYAGTGSVVISADTLGGNPTVTRIRYAGASSLYSKNGADTAISLGTAGLTGLAIGAEYVGNASYFIGTIALVAIVAGANDAARIAAVARSWYGI
jgi:hypothetical protein